MSKSIIKAYRISETEANSGRGAFGDGKTFYERFRDSLINYVSIQEIDRMHHEISLDMHQRVYSGELFPVFGPRGCVGFADAEGASRWDGPSE